MMVILIFWKILGANCHICDVEKRKQLSDFIDFVCAVWGNEQLQIYWL